VSEAEQATEATCAIPSLVYSTLLSPLIDKAIKGIFVLMIPGFVRTWNSAF
jgi:hypothetical protein